MCQIKYKNFGIASALVWALAFHIFMDIFDLEGGLVILSYRFASDIEEKECFGLIILYGIWLPRRGAILLILCRIIAYLRLWASLEYLWQRGIISLLTMDWCVKSTLSFIMEVSLPSTDHCSGRRQKFLSYV